MMRQLALTMLVFFALLADNQSVNAQLIPPPHMRSNLVAHLRVTNTGDETIHDLRVRFPNRVFAFGDVTPGATTPYIEIPGGVYGYAAYTYAYEDKLVDHLVKHAQEGRVIDQPVVDWVGESPLLGTHFTYQLALDPTRARFPLRLMRYTFDPLP